MTYLIITNNELKINELKKINIKQKRNKKICHNTKKTLKTLHMVASLILREQDVTSLRFDKIGI